MGFRCASIDGDADRLVYFFVTPDGSLRLLDGDKIAALSALYIAELVKGLPASFGPVQVCFFEV